MLEQLFEFEVVVESLQKDQRSSRDWPPAVEELSLERRPLVMKELALYQQHQTLPTDQTHLDLTGFGFPKKR